MEISAVNRVPFADVPLDPRDGGREPELKKNRKECGSGVAASAGAGLILPPTLGPFRSPVSVRPCFPPALMAKICREFNLFELNSSNVERLFQSVGLMPGTFTISPGQIVQWLKEPKTIPVSVIEQRIPTEPAIPHTTATEIFKSSSKNVLGYRLTYPGGGVSFAKSVLCGKPGDYVQQLCEVLIQVYMSYRFPEYVPRIKAVYRKETTEGWRFVTVSEYIPCGTLGHCLFNGIFDPRIGKRRALTRAEVMDLWNQTCCIYNEFSECGLVHNDAHRENVMVARRADGTLKAMIIDFGLATITGADGEVLGYGTPGVIFPKWTSTMINILGAAAPTEADAIPHGLARDDVLRAKAMMECLCYNYPPANTSLTDDGRICFSMDLAVELKTNAKADVMYFSYSLLQGLNDIYERFMGDTSALMRDFPYVFVGDVLSVIQAIYDIYQVTDRINVIRTIYRLEKVGGMKFTCFFASKSAKIMSALFPEINPAMIYY